ncbi:MAG: hypothetical protein LBP26_04485 [Clostridiales bacterium]|nr:hypothetical protein [Clostridiales bacterium]
MSKKATLSNIIERATVYEDSIEVFYRIKLESDTGNDRIPSNGSENDGNDDFDGINGAFLSKRFVQTCQQATWWTVSGRFGR